LGPEHPNTLGSMNRLALTMYEQGDFKGARRLQEATLAVQRRVLGSEHPDTLTTMDNLSNILHRQGDLVEARKLQKEVLEVSRRDLGPLHPATSRSAWNLFWTLKDLGERGEASTVLERDLLWLLDRAPATLGADQRQIRELVARVVKEND